MPTQVALLKQKDADVAAAKVKLDEATKNLTEAEQKLKVGCGGLFKLQRQLIKQRITAISAAAP